MSRENVHTDVPEYSEGIGLIIIIIIIIILLKKKQQLFFAVYTEIYKMSNQRQALMN